MVSFIFTNAFLAYFLLTLLMLYDQVGHKLVVKSTKATIDVGLPRWSSNQFQKTTKRKYICFQSLFSCLLEEDDIFQHHPYCFSPTKWCLLLYPNGNQEDREGFVSLYLYRCNFKIEIMMKWKYSWRENRCQTGIDI